MAEELNIAYNTCSRRVTMTVLVFSSVSGQPAGDRLVSPYFSRVCTNLNSIFLPQRCIRVSREGKRDQGRPTSLFPPPLNIRIYIAYVYIYRLPTPRPEGAARERAYYSRTTLRIRVTSFDAVFDSRFADRVNVSNRLRTAPCRSDPIRSEETAAALSPPFRVRFEPALPRDRELTFERHRIAKVKKKNIETWLDLPFRDKI